MSKFLQTFLYFIILSHFSFVYCWPSWLNFANKKKDDVEKYSFDTKVELKENSNIDILSQDKWIPDVNFVSAGQGNFFTIIESKLNVNFYLIYFKEL